MLCAEEILSQFARRAFRGPVGEDQLGLLLDLFLQGRADGSFDAGIQMALRAVLASPQFLFRSTGDPPGLAPGDIYALDDFSLASRLSFFLWSSVPDDELLELAEARRLSEPAVYAQQVKRMLADARAYALVENFAAQWLFLRNLQSARPDVSAFPNFDENLRRDLSTESALLVQNVIQADRSVLDLLDADYTFLNERLAEHYGVPGIYGSHFRRVDGIAEERRGLLGHGSILTVTSYPNRTSPVLRGKWVMENLLGTPPADTACRCACARRKRAGHAARSVRARLEEHRANPVCASCHDIMDPIGLALENYDAVGRWRFKEPGGEVDARGRLADGTEIDGPVQLREVLLRKPERFAMVVTEKLMTYALGRGLEYFDMPRVRAIVRDAEKSGYQFSSLIMGIVTSDAFRMKQVQASAEPDLRAATLE